MDLVVIREIGTFIGIGIGIIIWLGIWFGGKQSVESDEVDHMPGGMRSSEGWGKKDSEMKQE